MAGACHNPDKNNKASLHFLEPFKNQTIMAFGLHTVRCFHLFSCGFHSQEFRPSSLESPDSFKSIPDVPPLASYEKFRPGVSETFWTLYLLLGLQVSCPISLMFNRSVRLGLHDATVQLKNSKAMLFTSVPLVEASRKQPWPCGSLPVCGQAPVGSLGRFGCLARG